jgi:hypothetical protein
MSEKFNRQEMVNQAIKAAEEHDQYIKEYEQNPTKELLEKIRASNQEERRIRNLIRSHDLTRDAERLSRALEGQDPLRAPVTDT